MTSEACLSYYFLGVIEPYRPQDLQIEQMWCEHHILHAFGLMS
jgi:hypothetical protein